ncbi:hypothetical protein KTU01_32260 [Kocuria turfanensis]|uniref:Uncharacterized protein n=1 Tax=Kocuria turfanensis TaxID=388357 RepID=A0A512IHA2_9MICC|nr:hypothetical protein KTU01_32260 [Kocuria turfanensis]
MVVIAAADHDVAGQQGAELRFAGQGLAGQVQVAGAQDHVVADGVAGLFAELGGEGGLDVDLGEDAEALLGQGGAGAFHGLVVGQGDGDGVGAGHVLLL